jgi:DNA repair protein RadC
VEERPQPDLFARPAKKPARGARAEAPHFHGHRERLREKLATRGPGALEDYELLELVLFRALPRGDVKPLAKRLIKAFGDFNHALSAPVERLCEVEGVGEAVARELKVVEAAAHRLAQAKVVGGRAQLGSWAQVVEYLRTARAHLPVEEVRILYLDRKNVLIADETMGRGTVSTAPIYVRAVVKRALELHASAIIVAHNHPSGDPTPSQADIGVTRQLKAGLQVVDIGLHDHFVIGKGREASLHGLGLL